MNAKEQELLENELNAQLDQQRISDSTIMRLSKYYRTLTMFIEMDIRTVSSDLLAQYNGITAAQVRKDLSCFGAFGRRGLGYNVQELKHNIAIIMGLNRYWNVVLVGVGNIGRALLDYDQFRKQGFQIVLAYDKDPNKIGKVFNNITIKDEEEMEADLNNVKVDIAVVAVPSTFAQSVVDRLVTCGINAILNFAPINISVPKGVFIRSENMAIEIEALAFALTNPELATK